LAKKEERKGSNKKEKKGGGCSAAIFLGRSLKEKGKPGIVYLVGKKEGRPKRKEEKREGSLLQRSEVRSILCEWKREKSFFDCPRPEGKEGKRSGYC